MDHADAGKAGATFAAGRCVAVCTDLIFASKIASTAQSLGVAAKEIRSLAGLEEALAQGGAAPNPARPSLVLIDLDADVDVLEAIRMAGAACGPGRVIAYGSHVRADLLRAAREAGAGEALARSAFAARLPALLSSAWPQDAEVPAHGAAANQSALRARPARGA
jgi:DNA-binding NarL/FixJ family response regulator